MWLYLLIPFATGGLMALAVWCVHRRMKRIVDNGAEAAAVVVRTDLEQDAEGYRTYLPVLAYTAEDREYETAYRLSSTRLRFRDGEAVSVFYNRKNPREIVIQGDERMTAGQKVLLVAGAALMALSAVAMLALLYSDRI